MADVYSKESIEEGTLASYLKNEGIAKNLFKLEHLLALFVNISVMALNKGKPLTAVNV